MGVLFGRDVACLGNTETAADDGRLIRIQQHGDLRIAPDIPRTFGVRLTIRSQ